MSVNSFKQMSRNDVIKRRDDGMYIRLEDLHIEEGFNVRIDDEYTRAGDEALFAHMSEGGYVPRIEVVPRDEGGVWVREGHRRTRCYQRMASEGVQEIEWIPIQPFKGDQLDQIAHIVKSNDQLKLRFFEEAEVVKRLHAFNLTPDQIAAKIGRSRPHVDKLMLLAYADHAIKQLASSDTVSLDVIADTIRKEGGKAADSLQAAVKKLEGNGKKKVTRSQLQPPFKAKQGRRLAEIISSTEIIRKDDKISIEIPGDLESEIRELIDAYLGVTNDESGNLS